jgi:hypothetical protein
VPCTFPEFFHFGSLCHAILYLISRFDIAEKYLVGPGILNRNNWLRRKSENRFIFHNYSKLRKDTNGTDGAKACPDDSREGERRKVNKISTF